MEAKGKNGQVAFDSGMVTITRQGWLARVAEGTNERSFPVRQIVSASLTPPRLMTEGHVMFKLVGGEDKPRNQSAAVAHENTVIFTKKQWPDFEVSMSAIRAAMGAA